MTIDAAFFEAAGLPPEAAQALAKRYEELTDGPADRAWQTLTRELLGVEVPFAVHEAIFEALSERWDPASRGPLPAWLPPDGERPNALRFASERGLTDHASLHAWSVAERGEFWGAVADRLGYRFETPPTQTLDPKSSPEDPAWFEGAELNPAASCFQAPGDSPAIVFQREGQGILRWSLDEVRGLSGRVANGLVAAGFAPGDAIAIDMPMTPESVAIYLGIVRAGCAAISIADSFSPKEIETRLRVGEAKGIFTQDVLLRGAKTHPLFAKVCQAAAPRAIVLPAGSELQVELREGDLSFAEFLSDREPFVDVLRGPQAVTNVLFSSGTTGDPKAIPWTQLTPLKAAADGWLHQDIRPGDVVCWPTNLGWMMGPWLIYAALINKASIALYCGAPLGRDFGVFVQDAGVTMLGVVPSLVKTWRGTGCLDDVDWSGIHCFSSTGECSSPSDMLWLMSRAKYRPVIEYCGGTEIGGGYLTGSMSLPAAPGHFSTVALGLDLVLLDADGEPASEGEVFLIPPSIGLSQRLLNRDHHEVYHEGTPTHKGASLRRHGDWLTRSKDGSYRAQGRVDDTMNLGGIKVSSAELEAVLNSQHGVQQTAAIAVPPPAGGPNQLVVYVELRPETDLEPDALRAPFQAAIKSQLNPLFKVAEVRITPALPRTASNKVMRRTLRASYLAERDS